MVLFGLVLLLCVVVGYRWGGSWGWCVVFLEVGVVVGLVLCGCWCLVVCCG